MGCIVSKSQPVESKDKPFVEPEKPEKPIEAQPNLEEQPKEDVATSEEEHVSVSRQVSAVWQFEGNDRNRSNVPDNDETQVENFVTTEETEGAVSPSVMSQVQVVTTMDLRFKDVSVEEMVGVGDMLSVNKALTCLMLSGNNIDDKGAASIAKALEKNSTLTKLEMFRCQIRVEGARCLAESGLGVITTADFEENTLGDEGAEAFCEMLKTNTCLSDLNLSCNMIGNKGTRMLAAALEKNATIKTLSIRQNYLGEGGANALGDMLSVNSTLLKLDLSASPLCIKMDAKSVGLFAKGLTSNRGLKELDLSWHEIGNDGAKELGDALKRNDTLEVLKLNYGNIGLKGVTALAKQLEDNTSLTALHLGGNNITLDGAMVLGDMLVKNVSLKVLELWTTEDGNQAGKALNGVISNKNDKARMLSQKDEGEDDTQPKPKPIPLNDIKGTTGVLSVDLSNQSLKATDAALLSKLLPVNTSLTQLNLSQNRLGEEGGKLMAQCLSGCESLSSLNLLYNDLEQSGAEAVLAAFDKMRNLKTLCGVSPEQSVIRLQHNGLKPWDGMLIAADIRFNPNLTEVDLSYNKIGYGANSVIESVRQRDTVVILKLGGNGVGDPGAAALGEVLQKNTALKELELWNTWDSTDMIGDGGAHMLAAGLSTNSTLQCLDLHENRLSYEGILALSSALERNSSLLSLCLRTNEIGDEGAQALADMLMTNSTLQELDLNGVNSNVKLTSVGACALSSALVGNKGLTLLDLCENHIDDMGAKALASALEVNKCLTSLNLSWNCISIDGANALTSASEVHQPQVTITY
ncbi:hypothetical protein CYMTET_39052 [Cymbomonas tetramitiformis]|uniref:Uncharacterized protein n=1 Tax=Cymbomonas tetramitiformis TaxID=36881 RepID=A0AAE0F512_9CHLO|nr:hypothetical protein CYMTET_39052 [Cymbomonas tetramitiformis]